MKKLTMCAAAVAVLCASQANAGPDDVQLVGFVAPVCEVTGLNTQLMDFGLVNVSGKTVSTTFNMKCNDVNGAKVTMTSAEGGLESDDAEDVSLAYDASFTPSGLGTLLLDAPGGFGTNDYSKVKTYAGSSALASGITGTLKVVTKGSSPWAGGYSDTLTVNVTSI